MSIPAQTLPNLEIDVETPWPLKRDGKQVYAKLLDFGGFPPPRGTQVKFHTVDDIEWKQISWDHSYIAKSSDGTKVNLGLVSTPTLLGGGTMPWRFAVNNSSIEVNMLNSTDYREWDTVVLCLLYTKTSDGAESGSLIVPGPDGMVLTSRDNELVWEEAGSGCECEIAAPDKNGLVPEGGLPGQIYQVNQAGDAYEWRPGRIVRDSELALYVRIDGDDDNDGLADSPEQAKATLHGALKEVTRYDLRDNVVRIYMGPGEYSPQPISRAYSANLIEIIGAENYGTVINSQFGVGKGHFRLVGIRFDLGDNGGFFVDSNLAVVTLDSPLLNGTSDNAFGVHAASGGRIGITGNIKIQGTFSVVFDSYFQGNMIISGNIIVSGTLRNQFARAYNMSMMAFTHEVSINGQINGGVKYWVGANSTMLTNGRGPNFLPGTGAGSTTDGGVYY